MCLLSFLELVHVLHHHKLRDSCGSFYISYLESRTLTLSLFPNNSSSTIASLFYLGGGEGISFFALLCFLRRGQNLRLYLFMLLLTGLFLFCFPPSWHMDTNWPGEPHMLRSWWGTLLIDLLLRNIWPEFPVGVWGIWIGQGLWCTADVGRGRRKSLPSWALVLWSVFLSRSPPPPNLWASVGAYRSSLDSLCRIPLCGIWIPENSYGRENIMLMAKSKERTSELLGHLPIPEHKHTHNTATNFKVSLLHTLICN